MTKIYAFPGQGSQKKGMGAELFDPFDEYVQQADGVLGYSLRELCLEDPRDELNQTQFTQPALYAVNAFHYFAKLEQEADAVPHYLVGHSLGEYNALHAAGAFDFVTGLKLVQKRGALMGGARGGGMTAVLGLSGDQVSAILAENGPHGVDVANFNSPDQTVIAGPLEDLDRLEPHLTQAGAKRAIRLKVSAAFHSHYMESAGKEFAEYLQGHTFHSLAIPVIANVSAVPYTHDQIRTNLAMQIDHSVRWVESIEYLLQQPDPTFEELGPGKVLTRLIAQIQAAH